VQRLLDAPLGDEGESEIRNPKSEIPNPKSKLPYIPKPIDTSRVTLPPEIGELTEQLAENAHDHWAAQRLADGWTYGLTRDDLNKKHPCLVAYTELTDSEKRYDRLTAMETLKAIMALGYRIERTGNNER
jgi:ryanodine receptor 2